MNTSISLFFRGVTEVSLFLPLLLGGNILTKANEGKKNSFLSQLKVQSVMTRESRRQVLEAAHHITPMVKKQRVMSACK